MRTREVVRGALKQLPGLRSAYYLSIALRQMAGDQWRQPAAFDALFASRPDPWESQSAAEQERFSITLSLLERAGRNQFDDAVELGCAEGIFTERLAPLCRRLVALDFSGVALERARHRLHGVGGVQFARWDMRREPLAGTFDLVVAMGVLTSLYRPQHVKRNCDRIVAAVRPGGFLLFSDVRQSPVFEDAWWGRYVLRGGEQIRRLLARNPRLELVAGSQTQSHVFALFRSVTGPSVETQQGS